MPHFTTEDAAVLRVAPDFDLGSIDPDSTPGFTGKKADAAALFTEHDEEIAELQERMFANARVGRAAPSVLLLLQGMDTSGKGGIVRHVIGGVDPQGVQIASFKAPTQEERGQDFLVRIREQLPAAGKIGVFDRSHYEDVLIQRVRAFAPPEEIERRYGAIVDFEDELAASGTKLIKVMLHISKSEQGARLAERLERPDKHWKYNPGDVDERLLWDQYQDAYEIALRRTSTETSPWYCVPANRKWFSRLVVKGLLLDALRGFDLQWPAADFDVEVEKRRLAESA
ncbi:PPK2 family polyphosphate kinase [Pseudoclavibacter terrae]|uniref:PPK2 family polyphosphate kinase n=1 Tax=Pseudoclavibacter terrae TaxID=1530195 RepID=UPI00232BECBE|nr:PPK2 family polyphosphate kinase [Pseudoclavibacter terrae]